MKVKIYVATAVYTAVAFIFFMGTMTGATSPDIVAPGALLVNGATGRILYAHNPDKIQHPASMTKMMTEYLLLEAVGKGALSWNQKVEPSSYAVKIASKPGLSNVVLRAGKKYRIRELFEAMVIFSANGAAIALAEAVSGSESAFVVAMNAKGRAMGLVDFTFVNATGLNNGDLSGMHPEGTSATAENTLTPRAIGLLAYRLLLDYSEILTTSSIAEKIFKRNTSESQQMRNWNWMLPGLPLVYPGVDGLKTGSTKLAGYNFTATAQQNGRRLISVVMGTDSYRARFRETKKLLDYGFNTLVPRTLMPAGFGSDGTGQMTIVGGTSPVIPVFVESLPEILAVIGKTELPQILVTPRAECCNANGSLKAPLLAGTIVGYAVAKYSKQHYLVHAQSTPIKYPVIARETVSLAGWWPVFVSQARGWFLFVKGWFRRLIKRSIRYITDADERIEIGTPA